MKNLVKVIIIILLLLIAFIANKKNIPSAFDRDYYLATAGLNVRTGAGTGHSIFFTLQKGDEVEVLSKKKNWFKIRYQDKKGYAYSKYLKYSRTVPYTIFQFSQQSLSYIVIGIFAVVILPIGFGIFRKIRDKKLLKTVTNLNRGTRSERELVLELLKYEIPAQTIFHDLYLKKYDGHFSQIDLVVVTDVGIIVIEVKDYSGWIYGSGDQRQWTKVLAFGKQKYRFYNPIMQNNRHIAELRKKLTYFDNVPFYSIVLFYGDCVLKNINFVPNGTFIVKSSRAKDVINIITKNNEPFPYSNKYEVIRILKEAVENGEHLENQIQHIENVKDMLGTDRILD